MSYIQSILLGALQGIAEFLPISSSGHLEVLQHIMSLENIPVLYDVFLHVATLLAVVIVFRKRIAALFGAFFRLCARKNTPEDKPQLTMIWGTILATVITAVVGLSLKKVLPQNQSMLFIGICFICTAIILVLSEFIFSKIAEKKELNIKNSAIIGLAQGIGTLSGISRSGITISTSLFCGIDRKTAGEFSFILSIPAILGAFIIELKDADILTNNISWGVIIAGCVSAFVFGIVALKLLLKLIQKGSLSYFAWYLIPLGLCCIIFF